MIVNLDKMKDLEVIEGQEGSEAGKGTEAGKEGLEVEKKEGAAPEEEKKEEKKEEGTEDVVIEEGTEGKEKGEENPDEDKLINRLASTYGKKEDKTYDNTEEGIEEWIKDDLVPDSKRAGINELFEALPDVGDLAKHLLAGGSIDTWKVKVAPTQWDKVALTKENITESENIIRTALKTKKVSDKKIDQLIQVAKDSDTLFEDAQEELEFLKSSEEETKTAILKKEQDEFKAQQKQEEQDWNDTLATISKGVIGPLSIDKEQQKKFIEWIGFRGKSGQEETAREKALKNFTLEDQLLVDYVLMNKEKIADILKKPAKTELDKKKDLGEQVKGRKVITSSKESDNGESQDVLSMISKNKKGYK